MEKQNPQQTKPYYTYDPNKLIVNDVKDFFQKVKYKKKYITINNNDKSK
jgi:hypothetical protein